MPPVLLYDALVNTADGTAEFTMSLDVYDPDVLCPEKPFDVTEPLCTE